MDIDRYLERINSLNLKEYSVQNLFRLQKNHLLNIPFENLDVHLGIQIECNLEKIYDKIVVKKRGGFCCELNYLFSWLLKQLGYNVNILSCKAYRAKSNFWTPWFGHAILMINMNESNFLVDVGYSQNYRTPLKFVLNTVQVDVTGHYNITIDNHDQQEKQDTYIIKKCVRENIENESNWLPLYKFSTISRSIDEFKEMIQFVQSKDNPRFYNRSVCVIHTTYTVLNLVGYKLSEIKFSNSIEKSITHSILTKSEVYDAIKNIYGIQLDDLQFEPKGDDESTKS
jgi:N-hydroxyarylamine O-acetyltransferase